MCLKFDLYGKKLSCGLLVAAAALLLLFSHIKSPAVYTISLIGTEKPFLFFVTCLFMSVATGVNMRLFTRSGGMASKRTESLIFFCNFAMVIASFTMTADYVPAVTELHWICALLFMAVNPILILVSVIKKIRQGERQYLLPFKLFAPLYIFDMLYILRSFALFGAFDGKNGVMELIPIFSTFLLLFIFNHTAFFKKSMAEG